MDIFLIIIKILLSFVNSKNMPSKLRSRSRSKSRSHSKPKSRSHSKPKSRSHSKPKSRSHSKPRRSVHRKKAVMNYSRGSCTHLGKDSCSSDPNCHWTKHKKSQCRAKGGVRKGDVYEGPLPKQFK